MKRSALQVVLGLTVCALGLAQDAEHLRASQLMSMEVRGASGAVVGEIRDVVIDRPTGGLAYAVVSLSHVPGKTGKLFAVPWEALTPAADRKAFVIMVPNDVLANAQGFDPSRWPDMSDAKWVAKTASAFGVRRVESAPRHEEPRVVGARETVAMAPRRAATVVTGTVRETAPGRPSEAVIATGNGDVDVLLTAIPSLERQRLTFDDNGNVAVRGYPAIFEDRHVLVATEAMTHPGRWERIRNDDLTPVWPDPYPLAYQTRSLEGTIVSASNGTATVLTDEGYRNVAIAPSNYFESRHWRLRPHRPISVTGYDDPTTGNFVAITVDHEHESWRVRHDDGMPLWRDDASPLFAPPPLR